MLTNTPSFNTDLPNDILLYKFPPLPSNWQKKVKPKSDFLIQHFEHHLRRSCLLTQIFYKFQKCEKLTNRWSKCDQKTHEPSFQVS